MRISDWSSDVCSSDLPNAKYRLGRAYRPFAVALFAPGEIARRPWGNRGLPCADLPTCGGFEPDDFRRRKRRAALPGNRSEEHTSKLQSLMRISYAVFCLKKKKHKKKQINRYQPLTK